MKLVTIEVVVKVKREPCSHSQRHQAERDSHPWQQQPTRPVVALTVWTIKSSLESCKVDCTMVVKRRRRCTLG
jgi:hypothetical protein